MRRMHEWPIAPLLDVVCIESVMHGVTYYTFATCSQLADGMSVPYDATYQEVPLPTICGYGAHLVSAKDC